MAVIRPRPRSSPGGRLAIVGETEALRQEVIVLLVYLWASTSCLVLFTHSDVITQLTARDPRVRITTTMMSEGGEGGGGVSLSCPV